MKKLKKILKITGITLLVLIGLMIASTYIFRDKIVAMVKTEINKNLTSKVDFEEVDISFFRHFPRVSIGLDELSVVGAGIFKADTLLSARRLDATVNIMSFIRGKDMKIYSVYLNQPRIHALVTKDGLANWDIVKEDTTAQPESESAPFHLELEKYEITDGYIFYDDRESDMSAEIVNLDHSGSGDFKADVFTLNTTTSADELTYTYGAIPYLYKVKTDIDADIQIDNTTDKYSFENLNILLNALKITGEGFVKLLDNGYDMDISFKSADTDFKNILSLIPAVYKTDFDKVSASGTANFEGNIKGIYNEKALPGYHVSMTVKDGAFQYADLPKGIQQINLKAVVDNPDGITDHTTISITNGHFQIDKDPFDFRLLVKHPVTAMYVDAAAKGKLDLSQVSSFAKMDEGTSISGLLAADVSIKGNVSDLEKEQYQNFYADGIIDINGFNYTSPDYPSGVKINSLHTTFSPSKVELANLSGEYLNTNFTGSGRLNNLLNYVFSDQPLSANISIHADKIHLNDWMGVSDDTSSSATASAPFVVPANLDVVVNAGVNEMVYDDLNIKNMSGALLIQDETVKLNNIHGDALEGSIGINGSYSTKESKTHPDISLAYDVKQVDIQKTFYAFNTAQKLMPIGKFLAGKLTSSLTANGKLGEGMTVDMSTLSGAGNVLLIEGLLSKFEPLEKIATTLNISELQKISLKNVKAFFEFSNGKMLVKPFTVKFKDIEMEIGGLQGFDQSIDYTINMKLPRELLGPRGNQLINNLATTVSSKGIPVNLGETVNLKLELGGFLKNPTIKVDLKQTGESLATQMKEQVKEFAQAKIDSAKSAAVDSLKAIKKQLANEAKEALRKQLLGQKDSTHATDSAKNVKDKVKESAKGLLKGIFNKEKKE